jgi:hypothetical protein
MPLTAAREARMATKYYTLKLLGHTEPSGILRFFDDPSRAPEYFKKGTGWVASKSLWARIASGEIDDQDMIPEAEAAKIIEAWGGHP